MGLEKMLNDFTCDIMEKGLNAYDEMHQKFPKTTNYFMTAIGTVGGDAIAKMSQGEPIKLRDILFTSFASAVQAYAYPKVIDAANKINDLEIVKKTYAALRINKDWARGITITGLFFPVNMLYWNFLSVKNFAPINLDTNLEGAKSIAQASLPYLYVDYKVGKMDRKYALPIWSGAELGWNSFIALRNYLTR